MILVGRWILIVCLYLFQVYKYVVFIYDLNFKYQEEMDLDYFDILYIGNSFIVIGFMYLLKLVLQWEVWFFYIIYKFDMKLYVYLMNVFIFYVFF